VLSSAFSAIVVFAQELMPGKVGAVSGLFFGFAFGIGGIGAAVLGGLADQHGVESCIASVRICRCSHGGRVLARYRNSIPSRRRASRRRALTAP